MTRRPEGWAQRCAPYAGRVPRLLAPRYWGVHLLALVLVGIAIGLGLWQYDAWQEHRSAEAADLTHADPMPIADVIGPDDPFPGTKVGQPVQVAGTWVPDGTVYVSGREQDGRDGFWVVTPLAVGAADAPALPVVRGWVADPGDAPVAPTGAGDVVAWLQAPEGTGATDTDPSDDVLPQLRIADVIQHVDQDLYGAYGVAEEPEAGLEPATLEQLPDAGTFTGIRNLLYAIEWWFFGAFAAFIWWRWVTEETAEEAAAAAAADTSSVGP
jgi:surfeit locus 1 family protein